jgi:hypothetical protein
MIHPPPLPSPLWPPGYLVSSCWRDHRGPSLDPLFFFSLPSTRDKNQVEEVSEYLLYCVLPRQIQRNLRALMPKMHTARTRSKSRTTTTTVTAYAWLVLPFVKFLFSPLHPPPPYDYMVIYLFDLLESIDQPLISYPHLPLHIQTPSSPAPHRPGYFRSSAPHPPSAPQIPLPPPLLPLPAAAAPPPASSPAEPVSCAPSPRDSCLEGSSPTISCDRPPGDRGPSLPLNCPRSFACGCPKMCEDSYLSGQWRFRRQWWLTYGVFSPPGSVSMSLVSSDEAMPRMSRWNIWFDVGAFGIKVGWVPGINRYRVDGDAMTSSSIASLIEPLHSWRGLFYYDRGTVLYTSPWPF